MSVPRSPEALAARAAGRSRYLTGIPCRAGHTAERLVANGRCVACQRAAQNALNARPESKSARQAYDRARWLRSDEREKLGAANRARYAADPDRHRKRQNKYDEKHRDRLAAAAMVWRANNAHRFRAANAKRKRIIKRAMPAWADQTAILAIYAEADHLSRETGVLHHVDHEIPLQGKIVCGLHVENNLRPLPWRDNLAKKNKFTS